MERRKERSSAARTSRHGSSALGHLMKAAVGATLVASLQLSKPPLAATESSALNIRVCANVQLRSARLEKQIGAQNA